ncbi:MAG TPA: alkaline phosphatase family protein [Chitinophagaceae bacterium]|nr:alkaline phosphatase family protein [Chitinophagaceae bacterium]
MKGRFPVLMALVLLLASGRISGQTAPYTAANAHSHNDYEQAHPFISAWNEHFGSMEADIHLVSGRLLVGHERRDLDESRTLQGLYLDPLAQSLAVAGNRKVQLLIDVKTDAVPTLDTLVSLLKSYPALIRDTNLRIVISGNRPPESQYGSYPDFIWFDGRAGVAYTPDQLRKVALISDDYGRFVRRARGWPLQDDDRQKLKAVVDQAHQLGKPFRFWGNPDVPEAWEELMQLGVDYVNTDQISQLADYLMYRDVRRRVLPYNRILHSAGDVIRFGDPAEENHSLDIAPLGDSASHLAVVEERYGIYILDVRQKKILTSWTYLKYTQLQAYNSVYSGIQSFRDSGQIYIVWGASNSSNGGSALMITTYDPDKGIGQVTAIPFAPKPPARLALPNGVAVSEEGGKKYLYVVLNGNNELVKIDWQSRSEVWRVPTGVAPYGVCLAAGKLFVTNWAGETATDSSRERAGVPWGLAYTDPRTGATAGGTVSVYDASGGSLLAAIPVGLHPNAILASPDARFVYVANGSSDYISVIDAASQRLSDSIKVGLLQGQDSLQGSTPNGLCLSADGTTLYVSNGLDNAVAVVQLGKNAAVSGKGISRVAGFIPTEAYPAGLQLLGNQLVIANLESEGSNVVDPETKARTIHEELASVSVIDVPDAATLASYTQEVARLNLLNRMDQLAPPARPGVTPRPVPERLGEPSVFRHVIYIIKENKTYDQVFGDLVPGRGDSSLTVFGEKVTPNEHALARQFGYLDDYNASGKSSAEGHQWTDAGMVSDYVEKMVRAWFRSYPHRQEDALVYNKAGFIWNHALDHGKSVRIYGEACKTQYDRRLHWADIYRAYDRGEKPNWYNTTTIQRIRPIISPDYPDCDNFVFSDQIRADIFLRDFKQYEREGNLPDLLVLSLPNDHTAGTSPDFPTPYSMVADNDLALGRIVEAISRSKYWDSTVVFVTEDDSQSGWDHISSYRTVGLVISPYSTGRLVTTHYNQVSMLRTIEQILGLPPMNIMDATARLMTDCFQDRMNKGWYHHLPSNVVLNDMNRPLGLLRGKARKYARLSRDEAFEEVDGGMDDLMNRILWFYARGNTKYPGSPDTK